MHFRAANYCMRAVSIPETGKLLKDSTNLINWDSYLPVGDGQIARSINRIVPGCFDSKLFQAGS
jgi:hypothetical protein